MGLDHDKAQTQFFKEAFATALAATEALKTQVQIFDKTSALAFEQIVEARKERDDVIRNPATVVTPLPMPTTGGGGNQAQANLCPTTRPHQLATQRTHPATPGLTRT